MPVRSYFLVVGAILFALIFAADFVYGPQTRHASSVTSQYDPASSIKLTTVVTTRDLRLEFVPVRPVPSAEPVTTGVATTEPATEPSSPVTASIETPKQTSRKTAEVKKNHAKKKKTNIAATRPNWERYARGYQYDYWRPNYYGGYGGWN